MSVDWWPPALIESLHLRVQTQFSSSYSRLGERLWVSQNEVAITNMSHNNYSNTKNWLLGNRLMCKGLAVKWFLKLVLASDWFSFFFLWMMQTLQSSILHIPHIGWILLSCFPFPPQLINPATWWHKNQMYFGLLAEKRLFSNNSTNARRNEANSLKATETRSRS